MALNSACRQPNDVVLTVTKIIANHRKQQRWYCKRYRYSIPTYLDIQIVAKISTAASILEHKPDEWVKSLTSKEKEKPFLL